MTGPHEAAAPTRENLLAIWLDRQSDDRSPYGLYGFPSIWKTLEVDGVKLFTRSGKTQRRLPGFGYREEDGVHYQWKANGRWVGQGHAAPFDWFEENFASIIAGAVAEHGKTGVMPDRIPDLMVPRPAAQDPATSPESKDEETPSP